MSYLIAVLALIAYYIGAFFFMAYWNGRPRPVRTVLSFLVCACSAVLVFLATEGNPVKVMVLFIIYSLPLVLIGVTLDRRENRRASSKQ